MGDRKPDAGRTGGQDKPKLSVVVDLPERRDFDKSDAANLAASGLSQETIELAQLYTERRRAVLKDIIGRGWGSQRGNGLVFPLFYPGQDKPYAFRVRPHVPVRGIKYDQPTAAGMLFYYTPRARAGGWYADTERTLYWTEGEKKALVFDQLGLCCVGLTGVWNFHVPDLYKTTGELKLNPRITDHVKIAGRHHVICFDADALHNEDIPNAAARLAGLLLQQHALSVKFVHPPTLEHKGIDDFYAAFGEEVTRNLLKSPWHIEPADPKEPWKKVSEVKPLRNAPVNRALCIPDGYEIRKDGALWRRGDEKHGDMLVARSPILVVRYLNDYYTEESRLEVCFRRATRWVKHAFERVAIVDARSMIKELSKFGAPVNSGNAPRLVEWIDSFESLNEQRLEHFDCVDKTGWHGESGEKVFVLGEPMVSDQESLKLELDARGDRKRMFAALRPRGSYKRHLESLRQAWQTDPIAAAVICAALAAPLLLPLSAANFGVHLPGESSRGKTSIMKIGASVYGDPESAHWVASWNASNVGPELRAATLNDLPLCFDEVGAGDRRKIEQLVYMIMNGVGRLRAKKDISMRETPTWRCIMISTGEHEIVDELAMTGAQVRVISLPVSGFGDLGAAEVDALRDACAQNAGNFGKAWIEELLSIDDWSQFRDLYTENKRVLRGSSKGNSLRARAAGYWALLATAESMASGLGLGEPGGKTIQRLFLEHALRGGPAPASERALEAVRDWVASEPRSFPQLRIEGSGTEVPEKTGALVLHGYQGHAGELWLIPAQLQDFLARRSMNVNEVLREWNRLGWISGTKHRHQVEKRIGGQKSRYIRLSGDALGRGGDFGAGDEASQAEVRA